MNEFWFRPKTYGYGATPTTWEGWAVTAGTVIVIAAAALLIPNYGGHSTSAWITFFAFEVVVLAAFWIVCRRKTDGEWRWRWRGR